LNKYKNATTLKLAKARLGRHCDECGSTIEKGTEYFRESLGLMAKPPELRLRSFCAACGNAKARPIRENA
jgi:hypothetical protein